MFDIVALIAEQRIEEAIKNGELDNLPGHGKPLNLNDLSHVPPEFRSTYSLLKNSGFIPEEVDLLKDIEILQQEWFQCREENQKLKLHKLLTEKKIRFSLLIEKMHKKR